MHHHNLKRMNKEGGYIALMATIITSLILLVMAAEEGSSGWYSRFNILGTEAKEQASALAEGCADQALASIITDPTFGSATTIITEPGGTCTIYPIQFNTPAAGFVTIRTQAEVRRAYANLEIAMNMNDIHLGTPTPGKGTLVVVTQVINDGNGSSAPSAFLMNIAASNPSQTTFAGSDTGVVITMDMGPYTVTETTLPGYATTISPNCSGTINNGQIKFCTITNDDITTTLTLIANVKNDNSGTNAPADFPLFLDGSPATLGTRYYISAGTHTVTASLLGGYAASAWGYNCSGAIGAGTVTIATGQSKTCIISFDDLPPPAPSCADSVMILDRTGSMSSGDLANERAAALSLNNLYAGVLLPTPPPRLGVGSIGAYPNAALPAGAAGIPTLGQLSTAYTNIASAITSITGSNSSVGSDLSAGITAASNELNGPRHVAGNEKVLILVSDGDPNQPSGTTAFTAGFSPPTANIQNAVGDLWSSPTGVYADAGTDATSTVSSNGRHRFSNFGFGSGTGLPTGSTVTGIEVRADAWATSAAVINTPGNSQRSPGSTGAPNSWSNAGNAYTSDNAYATSAVNGQQQGYGTFGFAIPANATITGVQITTEAKTYEGGSPTNTETLTPNGQGSDTSWNGSESDIDETGTPSCSSGDRIDSNNNNNRESVNIDLSSIPDGSTVTSVQILTWDQGSSGGQYQDYASIGGARTNSATITVTSTSGCNARTQNIDFPDFIKSGSSDFEVGVQKVGNTTVQVGAIRAIVTYVPAALGSLALSLSSNNGSTWTAAKSTVVDATESTDVPSGNSTSDLWGRAWIPSDFNNGNFVLRIQNNSTTGTAVSLDQTTVTVFYTTPTPTGAACQLGVDLSWNAGTSWSNEKTQTLTGTETRYTLGASNDDWSSSHTWIPTDFSNTNFRARVHAVDPGFGCDNAAINHLDWLQVKVYYTQSVDPIQAALNAADTAKLAGVDLFTIHFGSDPSGYTGNELLANLATGATPVTYNSVVHQPGSLAQAGGVTSGATGLISPLAQAATSGGDGNGFELNPINAYADGVSYASNIDGAGDRHLYSGYNFTIPPGATITGIQTRLDWWLDSTSGTNSMGVELSWNGGTTWTAVKTDTNESTSVSNTRTLGATNDTWGHTWTIDELSSTNFRVRLTSNSSVSTRDFYLDWVPVTISYSVNVENSDGDYFFIAPTSADMDDIFDFIGNQVCPAILNLGSPPPPTTGTLLVITTVTNNNGGTKNPADFTAQVSATNPSQSSFAGSVSGVTITVDPGSYNITENPVNGYNEILGATCSSATAGTIAAGETRVCVLTNDDIPPPPPPPNFNINTGSWQEKP